MTESNLLKKAISDAGGLVVVASACGKTYQAVQKWLTNGLPRTEFSGETTYAATICALANQRGHHYGAEDLLRDTVAHRKTKAA